ncbi:MAG: rhodanese-like domain-containing protein [Deltaproteobacteria bacterium]|nr:MAG: rhodanese-like domain-containing protein [Deltaproteobacteria bacterium]
MSDHTPIGTPTPYGFAEIDVHSAERTLESFHLVDVREHDEFVGELGHIEGAALIPVGTVPARADEFPDDRPVLMICRSGARSARACEFLARQRGGDYYNLTGGMIAWNEAGLPTSREPAD